jgi:hypothetical protein
MGTLPSVPEASELSQAKPFNDTFPAIVALGLQLLLDLSGKTIINVTITNRVDL